MGKAVKYIPIYLILVTGILLAGKLAYRFLFASSLEKSVPVPVNVAVLVTKPQEYTEILELPGRLKAENSVMISSELTGRIQEWKVEEGAQVKKGDVLVLLNSDTLAAKLTELKAQERRSEASLELSRTSVKMAEINLDSAKNDVGSAENRLKIAVAENALAQDELARTTSLFEKKVASQIELDRQRTAFTRFNEGLSNTKTAVNQAKNMQKTRVVELEQAKVAILQAEAVVSEIEAGINSLRVALDKAVIRAPFSGVFDEYLAEVGEVVQAGDPLGHVFDYTSIRIRVDIADRYAPFMEQDNMVLTNYIKTNFPGAVQNLKGVLIIPGLPTLNGGRSDGVDLAATIVHLGKAGDPTSNTFPVELRAINPGGIFKQGLLARARIQILTYQKAMLIPLTAIRVTEKGPRCLVAVKDETGYHAESRSVEPRSIQDNLVMVQGELQGGERLILTGVQELLDGQSVAIIDTRGEPDNSSSTDK